MISIVICSVNPVQFGRISQHYRALLGNELHEIIGIHDARSLCEGYKRGMERSRGDIVVFSHDDIEIWAPEFTSKLKSHLERFDGIGVAGATRVVGGRWSDAGSPYTFGQVAHIVNGQFYVAIFGAVRRVQPGIQVMDGLFFAFRRGVISRVGWDTDTFDGFHGYDMDTTYRAHLMGYRLAVALDLPMLHMSHGSHGDTWKKYAAAFNQKHAATLASTTRRAIACASVLVPTKAEAIATMTAQYEALDP